MDTRVYIVGAMILGAGLIGGYGAHLADEGPTQDSRLRRYLLLGVIAAGAVPLFLSLVRSSIMREIFTTTFDPVTKLPYPPAYESYLIFLGIALIAAFSARRFIDTVSKQVLQRLDEVQETAQGAAATAADAKQVAREAVNEFESADERAGAPLPLEATTAHEPTESETAMDAAISPAEHRALQALSKRTYRTRTGIAEDSAIPKTRISEILEDLHSKKLAVPTQSPTTGGARWIITKRGEAALRSQG